MKWVVALLLLSSAAAAETTVGAAGRAQVILTSADTLIIGGRGALARTWDSRWQLGVSGGFALGTSAEHAYADALVEAGMWLHPSDKVDLELGWRAGYAFVRLSGGVHIHAFVAEPVIAFRIPIGARTAVHVEPFLFTAYHSGPWTVLIGPQVGLEWWL